MRCGARLCIRNGVAQRSHVPEEVVDVRDVVVCSHIGEDACGRVNGLQIKSDVPGLQVARSWRPTLPLCDACREARWRSLRWHKTLEPMGGLMFACLCHCPWIEGWPLIDSRNKN